MEMDIDPQELELLESNYRQLEEDLDLDSREPYLEEDLQSPHAVQSPPSPDLLSPSEAQINCQKRLRSDGPDGSTPEAAASPSQEKRSRIDNLAPEADEDWLRYSPPSGNDSEEAEQVCFVKGKTLSRYASEIDGECMPVTAPGGNRVYAKMNRMEGEERLKKLDIRAQSRDLISEPINVLLDKLDQEAFDKALKASSESQSVPDVPETPIVHEQLWVDKYAPRSFTELLSDEQTNREVLLWLKQWDSKVFGSEIRSTSDEVLSSLKRHSSIAQHQKPLHSKFPRMNRGPKWSNGGYKHSRSTDDSDDSKSIQDTWNKKVKHIGPPEQKILLLCGPPGFGKTTLAHVAARHCGYHVVEVNASDDRSSSTIEAKILDVVEMNSVMSDSRPKCLVVDEIDGALGDGKGAVEVLLKMVTAEKKSKAGKENLAKEQLGRKSSKKGHKTASLSRPVICICNDLYAPALRPLRQVAKVHMFVQPTVSRVVSRLKYICNKEGLKACAIGLTALAEYTECDIRSCLNTLQFLSKKKETLNVFDIGSQVVGRKDISRNALDIWKEVFQKKRIKGETKSRNTMYFEFDSLYSLVSSRGDYDLILDGIHENVLQLHYHDPMMQKTVKCFNSLGVSDLMHQHIMRTQQMPLLVYLPPVAITVHRLVAQVQKPNIEWPRSYQRYRTMMTEKMDILDSWHSKIPPHIATHLSASSFVKDLISPLLHILSPPTIRPVASQLLSDKEKNDLTELISKMLSYSVTYKNVQSNIPPNNLRHEVADGSALCFDPPIGDFINFKDYTSNHYVLSLAMKQVLLHEVERQKILRVSADRTVPSGTECRQGGHEFMDTETSNDQSAKKNHAAVVTVKNIESVKNVLEAKQFNADTSIESPNLDLNKGAADNVKLLNAGNIKKPPRSSARFFDRFIKLNSKGSENNHKAATKEAILDKDRRPVLFKYNEGYTNAVKRPVRIREFLL
ncbi:hypothetical protein L6164_013246 [Bauhinia variegata]|uniref:Uncharacterized protein n=1 Tax=Bauhinia variegata TaxID=167791 RepID=A0ACB9PCN5_BAUVA|nr:hypothetical protein L6164_013246 [Bauhinia variegata]